MTQDNLLSLCKDRFKNKNKIGQESFGRNLKEFIALCYLNCDPSSYGKNIMKKIIYDISKEMGDILTISDNKNKGDFSICYPSPRNGVKIKVDNEERIINFEELDFNKVNIDKWDTLDCKITNKILRQFFEGKVSFLGKNENYQIRNIRVYQDFEYYFFCLIDCEDDFTPYFYVLKKKDLEENFSLSNMNGTNDVISGTGFKNMGLAFKKNSLEHQRLKRLSTLCGTSFDDFIYFAKNISNKLRNDFEKTEFFEFLKNYEKFKSAQIVTSLNKIPNVSDKDILSIKEKISEDFLLSVKNNFPDFVKLTIENRGYSSCISLTYSFTNKPSVDKNFHSLYEKLHSKFIEFIGDYF